MIHYIADPGRGKQARIGAPQQQGETGGLLQLLDCVNRSLKLASGIPLVGGGPSNKAPLVSKRRSSAGSRAPSATNPPSGVRAEMLPETPLVRLRSNKERP